MRTVTLGAVAERSVAVALYAMVDRAAAMRPDLAAGLDGRVRLRWTEGYAPVVIEADGEDIVVCDDHHGPADAEIHAAMPDLSALILVPHAGGIPAPWTRDGRAALARVARGHVRITGSRGVARRLLRLLSEMP